MQADARDFSPRHGARVLVVAILILLCAGVRDAAQPPSRLEIAFAPHGTSIPQMWPFWLLGVAILLPLCWWYGRFKQRQPVNSPVRYL